MTTELHERAAKNSPVLPDSSNVVTRLPDMRNRCTWIIENKSGKRGYQEIVNMARDCLDVLDCLARYSAAATSEVNDDTET